VAGLTTCAVVFEQNASP
jgi:hypothetical protein